MPIAIKTRMTAVNNRNQPILRRMDNDADEVSPVAFGEEGDGGVADAARNRDHRNILAQMVFGSARRRENQAGREGKRNGCRGDQRTGPPFVK
jgi:hypothetical protein